MLVRKYKQRISCFLLRFTNVGEIEGSYVNFKEGGRFCLKDRLTSASATDSAVCQTLLLYSYYELLYNVLVTYYSRWIKASSCRNKRFGYSVVQQMLFTHTHTSKKIE